MERILRPRKTADLSDSVHHQLSKYALAAGAAGVSVLALSPSSEAKIVYSPTDTTSITPHHTIPLDLNHDVTIDFLFKDASLYIYNGRDFGESVGSSRSPGQQNPGIFRVSPALRFRAPRRSLHRTKRTIYTRPKNNGLQWQRIVPWSVGQSRESESLSRLGVPH